MWGPTRLSWIFPRWDLSQAGLQVHFLLPPISIFSTSVSDHSTIVSDHGTIECAVYGMTVSNCALWVVYSLLLLDLVRFTQAEKNLSLIMPLKVDCVC